MDRISIGRVAITWRGQYRPDTVYNKLDCVRYNNSSYICIENGTTNTLPTVTSKWDILAIAGSTNDPTQAQIDAIQATIEANLISEGIVFDSSYTGWKTGVNDAIGILDDWKTSAQRQLDDFLTFQHEATDDIDSIADRISTIENDSHLSDETYSTGEKNAVGDYISRRNDIIAGIDKANRWNGTNTTNDYTTGDKETLRDYAENASSLKQARQEFNDMMRDYVKTDYNYSAQEKAKVDRVADFKLYYVIV